MEMPDGNYAYAQWGGQACNPYDTTRVPRGTSAGSGVSVSANLVACSICEQGSASCKGPASRNNVVNFLTTRGLMMHGGMNSQRLGDRAGIVRMGDSLVPLDEALIQVAIDISGRPFAVIDLDFVGPMIGEAPSQMVEHVLQSFATAARLTLHVRQLAGANDHHIAEAAMKNDDAPKRGRPAKAE